MWIVLVIVAALSAVVAWNVLPRWRERMRGLTTVVEGAVGTAIYYFGEFTDAFQEARAAGLLPEGLATMLPLMLFVWIVVKRFQTTTAFGRRGG